MHVSSSLFSFTLTFSSTSSSSYYYYFVGGTFSGRQPLSSGLVDPSHQQCAGCEFGVKAKNVATGLDC